MTNLASDVAALPSMVARLNIELFCKKLAEETNEAKRQTLLTNHGTGRRRQSEQLCLFLIDELKQKSPRKRSRSLHRPVPHFQQNARDRRPQCAKV